MEPETIIQDAPHWPVATSRKAATIANLVHQYVTIAMTIVYGIVMVPLYLYYIGLTLYGAWLASGNIVAWLTVVEGGVNDLLRQQTSQAFGERNHKTLGVIIGSGTLLNALLGLPPVLVGFVIAPFIPGWLHVTGGDATALSASFLLASLSVTFMLMGLGPAAVQQGLQRNVSHCIMYTISTVIGMAVTIAMLVTHWGLVSIPAGFMVRSLLSTLLYWSYVWHFTQRRLRVPLEISLYQVRRLMRLTVWTLASRLTNTLLTQTDNIVVALMLGVKFTPILALTSKPWEMSRDLVGRLGMSFMPGLAHLHGEGNRQRFKEVSVKLMRVVVVLLGITCGACLALNRSFVRLWVGQEFYAGNVFNVWLAAASTAMIITLTLRQVLFAAGMIWQTATADMAQGLIRTAMLIGLLALVGLWGAPASTAVSIAAVTLWYLLWQWSRRCNVGLADIRSQLSAAGIAFGAALALGVVWMYLPLAGSWAMLVGYAAAYGVVAIAAVLAIDRGSRNFAVAAARRVFRRGRRAP